MTEPFFECNNYYVIHEVHVGRGIFTHIIILIGVVYNSFPDAFLSKLRGSTYWGYGMLRKKEVKEQFAAVREELDGHLDAINENTHEILENRAMIMELQERMCKLSDKITGLVASLEESEERMEPLTLREQEVFMCLYMSDVPASYGEIARRTSLPVSLVQEIVDSLTAREIPLIEQRNDRGHTFIAIEESFRERQAKQNVLGIDESLSKQLSKEFQLSLLD